MRAVDEVSFGLLCVLGMTALASTLPGTFRRRLREFLEKQSLRQGAVGKALGISQGRISRILKYDAEAGTVTVERLGALAKLLHVSPAELVREAADSAATLTPREAAILSLIREMPEEQQQTLHSLLAFTFSARQEARQERALLRVLRANLARELSAPARPRR